MCAAQVGKTGTDVCRNADSGGGGGGGGGE